MENGGKTLSGDALARLLDVMAALRTPVTGCPWDLAQTAKTIAPHTIEEAYEVADAIERGDSSHLKDELGDLLFNIVYHARIAEEAGEFDFAAVANAAADKMTRRHPYVFGAPNDPLAQSARADPQATWSAIKAAEKAEFAGVAAKFAETGALDGVEPGLPALTRAVKLQKRAKEAGFDWPDFAHVLAKVDEELAELKEALMEGAPSEAAFEEFGDLLFAVTQIAWRRGFDPDSALRAANSKFTRRFRRMELAAAGQSAQLKELNFSELLDLWTQAKDSDQHQIPSIRTDAPDRGDLST